MERPDHWQRYFLLPESKKDEIARRVDHLKMYCFSTPETEASYARIHELLKGLDRE